MTSKTRHKSLEDENEDFGGRGRSLGKAQYKTTRWKAKQKDAITWGEAVWIEYVCSGEWGQLRFKRRDKKPERHLVKDKKIQRMHKAYKTKETARLPNMNYFIFFYSQSSKKLTGCKEWGFPHYRGWQKALIQTEGKHGTIRDAEDAPEGSDGERGHLLMYTYANVFFWEQKGCLLLCL